MKIALVCDPRHAVLVHKSTWVADGFRAAGHTVRLVHDLAGVRAADAQCDLLLFDHKASGLNRAALAELARRRLPLPPHPQAGTRGRGEGGLKWGTRCSSSGPHPNPLPKGEGTVWVQWWRDLIAVDPTKTLADQDYIRSFGGVMRGMDIVFVKERSLLDEYHALGINAYWLDQACPAEMPACEHRGGNGDGYVLPEHLPLPLGEGRGEGGSQRRTRCNSTCPHPNPLPKGEGTVSFSPKRTEWDVLVLGSPGYAQRRADARALAEAGFRVLWAGMPASDPVPPGIEWHPWVHPLKLPELVSRCGVVLGVDWRSDLPGYTSDRLYLACGMGACYIARCDQLPLPLPPGEVRGEGGRQQNTPAFSAPQAALAAWVYETTDELIEIVRQAMSDVNDRRRRGERSRRLVMERHTYSHRAMEIVNLVCHQL